MTMENQDFTVRQGTLKVIKFTVVDENTSAARDLTGNALGWILAKNVGSTTLISKTTAAGTIVITDAANGICQVAVDPGDWEDLVGDYYHELAVLSGPGSPDILATGTVTLVAAKQT